MSLVAVVRDGALTRVTLDRADKLNAFNAELVAALQAAVDAAQQDGTRLLVFRGAGKGFSGGFDLSDVDAMSDGDLLLRFVRVEQLLQSIFHARPATLAFAHGPCYGAAADLFAACQWRVSTPTARFRMPGARFGLVLGTRRLASLVGADQARALLLRDKPFAAEEALKSGFATELCAEDGWAARERGVLGDVEALGPDAFASLSGRMIADTRDADLAALVRSTIEGSIRSRVLAYLEEVAAAKRAGK